MDGSTHDWAPPNAFYNPAWRWERAQWLVSHPKQCRRPGSDEWLDRAKRYLTAVNVSIASRDRRRPPPWRQHIETALGVWRDSGPQRDLLEAYLLTREPFDIVGQRCRLDVATVEAYHELFFDVRPRLGASDWIMSRAIGASYGTGFGGKPFSCLWKYFAFVGGPLALELVIAVTTGQKLHPAYVSALSIGSSTARQETYLRTLCGLTVGALTEESPRQLADLNGLLRRLQRIHRRVEGRVDRKPDPLPAMQNFLAAIAGKGTHCGKRVSAMRRPSAPTKVEIAQAARELGIVAGLSFISI